MTSETRKLLTRALAALGPAPSYEEMELVVETLHALGNQDLEDAFAEAADDTGKKDKRQSSEEIYEIARETEAHAFTAHDLIVAMVSGVEATLPIRSSRR